VLVGVELLARHAAGFHEALGAFELLLRVGQLAVGQIELRTGIVAIGLRALQLRPRPRKCGGFLAQVHACQHLTGRHRVAFIDQHLGDARRALGRNIQLGGLGATVAGDDAGRQRLGLARLPVTPAGIAAAERDGGDEQRHDDLHGIDSRIGWKAAGVYPPRAGLR